MCPSAPDGALSAELTQQLSVSSQQDVWPIGLSKDGQELYVETTTRGFHGIAAESTRTGAILTRIERLPPDFDGAQGTVAPDGDVVWMTTYRSTTGSAGTSAVQLWSPQTRTVTALEPPGQRTGALSAPVLSGTSGTFAAWEQADGSQQEIVEANLATGVTDVIARGYVGPPVFVGSALVWPLAGGAASAFVAGRDPQSPSKLVAVNAATFPSHGPVAVPRALQAAGSASLIASDGADVAYSSPDETNLFFSPSPSQPARLVFRLQDGNTFTPGGLAFGAGYLSWETASAVSYLASLHDLAVAAVPGLSAVVAVGSDIIIESRYGSKTQRRMHVRLLAQSVISGLTCAAAKS